MTAAVSAAPNGSGAMFDRIAPRYDLLNRLISFGMDGRWRRALLKALDIDAHTSPRVLDVATGTADIALGIARAHPTVAVCGLDPSPGMLAITRDKIARADFAPRIELVEGDAQDMPFEDGAFSASCMAFGIRNVPERTLALSELRRVTTPGGRIVILELSEPRGGMLAALARVHVHHVVPRIGALISGDPAYRYLERSIAAFPAPDDFANMMEQAGMTFETHIPYAFGAANLFVARARSW